MKRFKVAHIVPVSHLNDTKENQYHMCLAHLMTNDEYRNHFIDLAKNPTKYVLLDNGAAEGSQLDFDRLINVYKHIKPREVVLPDTLFNSGSTIQKTRNFLEKLQTQENELYVQLRFMAVPQGKSFEEWKACARILIQDERIHTIGISKFLNITTKDRYIRFEACKYIWQLILEYGRIDLEVHLLGCDEGPLVVKMCHEAFEFVRGCDSAFAYLQSKNKKYMSLQDDSRPAGSIDFLNGDYQDDFVTFADNFNKYAGCQSNESDKSWEV